MKRARGRETATKPRVLGASGTPGASAHRPGPAGSHERRRRSRAILFFPFPFLFSFPSQPANLGGWLGVFLFFCLVFFFLNIWKFLHPLRSEKKKKKSLNETKPKEPIFDLGSLAGR